MVAESLLTVKPAQLEEQPQATSTLWQQLCFKQWPKRSQVIKQDSDQFQIQDKHKEDLC